VSRPATLRPGQRVRTRRPQVMLPPLPPGRYRVRLCVRGPGGESSTAEVRIEILPRRPRPLP
jgi:hypothetical protein